MGKLMMLRNYKTVVLLSFLLKRSAQTSGIHPQDFFSAFQ